MVREPGHEEEKLGGFANVIKISFGGKLRFAAYFAELFGHFEPAKGFTQIILNCFEACHVVTGQLRV